MVLDAAGAVRTLALANATFSQRYVGPVECLDNQEQYPIQSN